MEIGIVILLTVLYIYFFWHFLLKFFKKVKEPNEETGKVKKLE